METASLLGDNSSLKGRMNLEELRILGLADDFSLKRRSLNSFTSSIYLAISHAAIGGILSGGMDDAEASAVDAVRDEGPTLVLCVVLGTERLDVSGANPGAHFHVSLYEHGMVKCHLFFVSGPAKPVDLGEAPPGQAASEGGKFGNAKFDGNDLFSKLVRIKNYEVSALLEECNDVGVGGIAHNLH